MSLDWVVGKIPLPASRALTSPLSEKPFFPRHSYVGGLPASVDDAGLNALFTPFGAITSCKVVTEPVTGVR